jgi:hypothetical protein
MESGYQSDGVETRHRQHAVGAKARIDREQIAHGANHQARAGDEHHSERDLRRDERLPPAETCTAARRAAAAFAKLAGGGEMRRLREREQAGHEGGEAGDNQREQENAPINGRFGEPRQTGGRVSAQKSNGERGERDSGRTAERGEDGALGDEQSRETLRAGAERDAHG